MQPNTSAHYDLGFADVRIAYRRHMDAVLIAHKPWAQAKACFAMPVTVSGTVPVGRTRPALSNRMTSRPDARGSVTAGSQLSSVPVLKKQQGNS
jgi:hypothetical protein